MPSELVEPSLADLPARTGPAKSVVVVGAGAAGLTAAYQLKQAGHHVQVFEARMRPGGRVHAVWAPFSDGLSAEAGAFFVPSDHDYLMKYVRLTGLESDLVPVPAKHLYGFVHINGERALISQNGVISWPKDGAASQPISHPLPQGVTDEERRMGPAGIIEAYFKQGDRARQQSQGRSSIWPPPDLLHLDQFTVAEFAQKNGASEAAARFIAEQTFGAYGEFGSDVSALFALREFYGSRSVGFEQSSMWNTMAGGNDRWHKRLAVMLRNEITYGAPVVALEHGSRSLAVTIRTLTGTRRITADHVVFAVPFSCLREVHISPGFSPDKARAINDLQPTAVGHLFIQCRQRVWIDGDRGLFALGYADIPGVAAIRDSTYNQSGTRGILNLFMVGDRVRRYGTMSDEERLNDVLPELESIFPGLSEQVEGVSFFSWDQEQWSRGDYIYYRPGDYTSLHPHIAHPEGRVHFAGDHTSQLPEWQEGAITSAHRAAREVHEA